MPQERKTTQSRSEKTRQRILKAATRLFARHGYHGTSVDRIASTAKANKQRIYEYYTNKKKLFETCLVAVFEEVSRKETMLLGQINDQATDMTRIILRYYMDIHDKYPHFWKLIAWANLEPEPFYLCLKNIKDESYHRLKALYEHGQTQGIFKTEVSFEVYMFILLAATYFYHSNRKTLSSTLNDKLFAVDGTDRIINECTIMLESAH